MKNPTSQVLDNRLNMKGQPLTADEFNGVPFKRERVNCQFRQVDYMRFKPMNEAAHKITLWRSNLGWLSKKRLDEIAEFVEIDYV